MVRDQDSYYVYLQSNYQGALWTFNDAGTCLDIDTNGFYIFDNLYSFRTEFGVFKLQLAAGSLKNAYMTTERFYSKD